MKFLYIIFIILLFTSCKKEKYYELKRPSSWYYNNEQIDVALNYFFVQKKLNGKYRYQVIISNKQSLHIEYDDIYPEGTVLTMSFMGDTLTELDANQQIILDSTCYIAWGVNYDSSSFENKEYFTSGYLSITARNPHSGMPYQISFTGITDKGNTVDLTSYVNIMFNQGLFQTVKGQFTYKDSLYMLSFGSYSGMNGSNFHQFDFFYADYENHSFTQLNVYLNNNGSSELDGEYNDHFQDSLHYFTVLSFFQRDRNDNVTWKYFYNGHISIVNEGRNYTVSFDLTDQSDTISGYWTGPFE